MRTIQPSFDFYRRPAQPGTHFLSGHSPTNSIPADGIILRHLAGYSYTENLFQPLLLIQSSMRIASIARYHREALFPLRQKTCF